MASARAAVDLDRVNYANVGLMLGSAALACVLPFEVFLASYAILGPLHYLTQISWLHDRRCFTTGRFDWVPLALLSLFALDAVYLHRLSWNGSAFVALALGAAAAFARSTVAKVAALLGALLLTVPLLKWPTGTLIFAGLLPTVIHVYLFTGLFILAGSLKSRSRSGYVSLAVFVACGAGLLLLQPDSNYQPGHYALANLKPFESLIDALRRAVPGDGGRATVSAIGRFLGFAYTYHYLNWFSKTGVIRWHEISRARMAAIGALWLASIGLYAWDYAIGLEALFLLSIAHVFLEFPLDARTLVGVVKGLRGSGGSVGSGAVSAGAAVRMPPVAGR